MQWIVKATLLAAKKNTLNVLHVYILHEGYLNSVRSANKFHITLLDATETR